MFSFSREKSLFSIVKLTSILLVHLLVYALTVFIVYNYFLDLVFFNGSNLTLDGYILETLSLFLVSFVFLFITRRKYLSLFLTLLIYIIFILINTEKINILNAPLSSTDLFYFDELILAWDVFITYIPKIILSVLSLIVFSYIFVKNETTSPTLKKYKVIFPSLLAVLFIFIAYNKKSVRKFLNKGYSIKNRVHMVVRSEKTGLLFNFTINSIFVNKISPPHDYTHLNIEKVASTISKINNQNNDGNDVSLIIYLIESFSDPQSAGIQTTKDPIPFFHQLQKHHNSGFVYSPVVGGKSANAEFELLTGFSMQFFPSFAIAYNDIPYRNIPSIANELNHLGYYSSAIHVADLGFFNYKQMYKMQGFNNSNTLWNDNSVEKDPAGRFPSDSSLVEKIIDTGEKHEKFFIFAFPNSTHGKWDYPVYLDSPIDLLPENSINYKSGKNELKTYLNALNTADLAIKKLISHYKNENRKVAILVMGDHQPGLAEFRELFMLNKFNSKLSFDSRKEMKRQFRQLSYTDPLSTIEAFYSVPYVLWTNYEVSNKNSYQKGMNSLVLKIFDTMNISPQSKFYSFLSQYSQTNSYKSLLEYIIDKKQGSIDKIKSWHSNFELIQYDLLYGEQYLNQNNID